jgi:hypothetical protein
MMSYKVAIGSTFCQMQGLRGYIDDPRFTDLQSTPFKVTPLNFSDDALQLLSLAFFRQTNGFRDIAAFWPIFNGFFSPRHHTLKVIQGHIRQHPQRQSHRIIALAVGHSWHCHRQRVDKNST